jgi:hypothetical protein
LVQAYKNLFPDMTRASVPAVTVLRGSLGMYVLFVDNNIVSSLLVLLTAHRNLLSKQPSHITRN